MWNVLETLPSYSAFDRGQGNAGTAGRNDGKWRTEVTWHSHAATRFHSASLGPADVAASCCLHCKNRNPLIDTCLIFRAGKSEVVRRRIPNYRSLSIFLLRRFMLTQSPALLRLYSSHIGEMNRNKRHFGSWHHKHHVAGKGDLTSIQTTCLDVKGRKDLAVCRSLQHNNKKLTHVFTCR